MMATPPSFRGGSQSSLTTTLPVVVGVRFIGGEGEPGKNAYFYVEHTGQPMVTTEMLAH